MTTMIRSKLKSGFCANSLPGFLLLFNNNIFYL